MFENYVVCVHASSAHFVPRTKFNHFCSNRLKMLRNWCHGLELIVFTKVHK